MADQITLAELMEAAIHSQAARLAADSNSWKRDPIEDEFMIRAVGTMAISLERIANELSYSDPIGRTADQSKPYTLKDLLDIVAEDHA